MNLLYVSIFLFYKENGQTYALPSCSDSFFQKYLDVFDYIKVLGAPMESYLDKKSLVQMTDNRISVDIIAPNTKPKDFINDKIVRLALEKEISKADAILIKPATRRGMMAIDIAKKYKKPYMIEMTGDIHNALRQHPNFLKRMYAPIFYRMIKSKIKDCKFGLYVSQEYLQHEFPIKGRMCGCSDVVLEKSSTTVLENRLKKISNFSDENIVNIALIGFYQGKMKGIDTAIKSLSHLPDNYHLSILGNGSQNNRDKWFQYAKKNGVSNERIHFPKPLPSVKSVLQWLDSMDFFVLPTRSEGLSRSVVEAMSRGCICFATNVCSMPELLPSECLFEVDDDQKLANLLVSYASDTEKMKKIAKINFEKSMEYDFDVLKQRRNEFLTDFHAYAQSSMEKN